MISCSALPFGVTTETLATQDPEAEDEETDTPIYEKYDAMLHESVKIASKLTYASGRT